jgi:hypothetical protein
MQSLPPSAVLQKLTAPTFLPAHVDNRDLSNNKFSGRMAYDLRNIRDTELDEL